MKDYPFYVILMGYAVLAALTIIYFDGTGDGGDSVNHYLHARYAPAHPELFFNHWAEPVYVLLASPFAQMGFIGIKVFNAIATFFTILLTYRIARDLNLKNAGISALILLCTPQYYVLTFSGLTEPLFALFTATGVYAAVRQRFLTASIVISFLPFVRSEGLIIAGVFALYFLLKGRGKVIPALLTGHLVYSVAGYFVYHDLLWVFTKIPYANMGSPYGSGKLFHFAEQFFYVVGVPVYILFCVGIVALIYRLVVKGKNLELHVLILGGFFAFFIAHSLFWYLGIFNSMGLKRVLIGVMPMTGIITLSGFNFITAEFTANKKQVRVTLTVLLAAAILLFPFTANKAALHFQRDLQLTAEQHAIHNVAKVIREEQGLNHRFLYNHPYVSEALQLDPFDHAKRIDLTQQFAEHMQPGDIIIWESWFAPVEFGVNKELLDAHPRLSPVFSTAVQDKKRLIEFVVYLVE